MEINQRLTCCVYLKMCLLNQMIYVNKNKYKSHPWKCILYLVANSFVIAPHRLYEARLVK